MGFFDSLKDSNKLFVRNDDKDGTTIQRFDSIKLESSRAGVEYLKLYKTVIRVIAGEKPQVGDETTLVVWPDANGFAERDLRNMFRALFGLDVEEANALTIKKMHGHLVPAKGDSALVGMIFEQTAREVMTQSDKLVTNVTFTREVATSEITEEEEARFWPKGLPESEEE